MADAAEPDDWSGVADGWAELWEQSARPAQDSLAEAAGIGPGTRVLDVGCGGGAFLRVLRERGAHPVGVDPSLRMREIAAAHGSDVRPGDAEHLPFPGGSFDVVTAVNALHFASDPTAALREFARVLAPGGRIAVANWAERERNDIDVVERAVAEADETDPLVDDPLRVPGGLEAAFAEAGVRLVASGLADTPWTAADEDTLVRGILLGEDPTTIGELRTTVVAAAAPFRTVDGYLFHNAFRWAVGAR